MKERVLPPHCCQELKEAGYPQSQSEFVWVYGRQGQWDLVLFHEAPSKDNRIVAMTTDEANKWTFENEFLQVDQCEDLISEGYPRGKSIYLWHKDKHQHDKWVLYKRNRHDMSQDADKHGYNRWITAITHDEAEAFRTRKKAMIESADARTKPVERDVGWLTFCAGDCPDPRTSASIFATSCRGNLINITEICPNGYTHITVYYWKEE